MTLFGYSLIILLLVSGAGLWVALGVGSTLIMLFELNMSPFATIQIMFGQIASWPLLAMPLFILAGSLMLAGGSAKRLIDLFDALAGHLPGGLIIVVVLFCTLFSALSGSGYAAIAAVGTIMFPEMHKHGYSDKLSTGVMAVTGDLGILIPPSILFIVLGMLMQTSAASLFAAGMMPGILLAIVYCIVGLFLARREKVTVKASANWKARGDAFVKAIPAAVMPVVILGGIYTGFFTPTEAAAVACFYAILIGATVYRGFTWQNFWDAFVSTAKTSIVMYMMIASIGLFSYVISIGGAPKALAILITGMRLSPTMFAAVFCTMFVLLGFIFNPWGLMWILIPVLLPTFHALGANLLWVGVLFCIATMIGTMTPPMCVGIYFTAKVAKVSPGTVIRGVVPFLIAEFIILLVVVFFPEIALWLPRTMGLMV